MTRLTSWHSWGRSCSAGSTNQLVRQVAAVHAKGDGSRVRLRGFAVALEDLKVANRIWAEPALDHADGPRASRQKSLPAGHFARSRFFGM